MGWPLDPRTWWTDGPQTSLPEWLDHWSDATRWWLDPARPSPTPERALLDLIEGVGGRFRGRRLTFDRSGQPVSMTLEDIRVVRRSTGEPEVDLRASNVEWEGLSISTAWLRASDVAVELGITSTVVAGSVQLEGEADSASVGAWLASSMAEPWQLAPRPDGLVEARRPGTPVLYAVAVQARDGQVEAELRELGWRGRRVKIPHWLRLTRSWPVPPLPRAIHVASATVEGDRVRFRLRWDDVREPLLLDGVRDAILEGVTQMPWPVGAAAPIRLAGPTIGPVIGPKPTSADDALDF